MQMNLARTGTVAGVGLVSGVLGSIKKAGVQTPLFLLGTTAITYDIAFEAVALVGGALLQFTSPNTLPDVVDGLVDGGAALLFRRAGGWVGGQIPGLSTPAPAGYAAPGIYNASPWAQASPCSARGAVGGVGVTAKKELI